MSNHSRLRSCLQPNRAVGGNHEASNHLWELYYGGWAAPRIFYLGHAGVVTFGGIRIGGLSGIYNANHYRKARCASPQLLQPLDMSRHFTCEALCWPFNSFSAMAARQWPNN